MGLYNETGHASQDDRNAEAERLISELEEQTEYMDIKERTFVQVMNDRTYNGRLLCTREELSLLEGLYEKYCL